MTCVYWEGEDQTAAKVDASAGEEAEASRWSVKGCWVAYSDENYTICSCSHLSTFALILQIGDVRTKQPTLSRVDCSMCRVCVCVCGDKHEWLLMFMHVHLLTAYFYVKECLDQAQLLYKIISKRKKSRTFHDTIVLRTIEEVNFV